MYINGLKQKNLPAQSFFRGTKEEVANLNYRYQRKPPGPTDSPATKAPQIWPHRCVVQCDPCHHNRQQQSWATSLAASVPKPEPRSSLAGWVQKSSDFPEGNYPMICWGPGVFHPTAWCLWEGIEKLLDDWMVEVKLVDLNPKKQAYVKEMICSKKSST